MKKVCTFTVEGEDYYSSDFRSNLRLIAHLLYESIRSYDDYKIKDRMPLVLNKNIVYNNIHEDKYGVGYFFDSDLYGDSEFVDYEPFIVENRTFGFTINDGLISEDEIKKLVVYVLNLLKLDYKITIDSVSYQAKNIEDERYRWKAIKMALGKLGYRFNRKVGLVRRLMKPSERNKSGYYYMYW